MKGFNVYYPVGDLKMDHMPYPFFRGYVAYKDKVHALPRKETHQEVVQAALQWISKEFGDGMIGKKVFGIDGPGQSPEPGLAGQEGEIVNERKDRWGEFWTIRWESGHQEDFYKDSVKPKSEANGIGVYYE